MQEDRTSWPLIVGVTAGVVAGVIAGIYLYATKDDGESTRLRDAKEIIAQCHAKIKEIEDSLQTLKEPTASG